MSRRCKHNGTQLRMLYAPRLEFNKPVKSNYKTVSSYSDPTQRQQPGTKTYPQCPVWEKRESSKREIGVVSDQTMGGTPSRVLGLCLVPFTSCPSHSLPPMHLRGEQTHRGPAPRLGPRAQACMGRGRVGRGGSGSEWGSGNPEPLLPPPPLFSTWGGET